MSPYANPKLCCDIVMKGGITSGVVYPGAVLKLAPLYRFKSIGGASAGGIAAAVAAAAEYGRDSEGFERLEKVPGELAGQDSNGDPLMLQLFQAERSTRPAFNVLIGFLRGREAGAWAAVKAFWRSELVAGLVAVASILLSVFAGADPAFAVGGVFAAVVMLVIGIVREVLVAVRRLPANDFGLCRLGPDVGTDEAPALTGWLHQQIQSIAGRTKDDAPLTFAELWAGPGTTLPPLDDPKRRLARLVALSRDPSLRAIDLQMMTTDLTHGRPLRLPVPYRHDKDKLEQGGGLLFDPFELEHFFPEPVVEHLKLHAQPVSDETLGHLKRLGCAQLRHFPIGPDLPVVVATRMTLSFPVLISAIPLYELDFRTKPPALKRVLFSDGGITSNFPVHFFDSPLPTRPTFGLNLIGFEPGEAPDRTRPCDAVRPPAKPSEAAYSAVAGIEDLMGFATALKDAAQNWRDNAQAELPGYRDRIVHLKLAKGEGGLKLTMAADKITELNERGECAGVRLRELFGGDGTQKTPHWNEHRYVRYRTIMSLTERALREYRAQYEHPADAVTTPYDESIPQHTGGPYAIKPEKQKFAKEVTDAYRALVAGWDEEDETFEDSGVPRPRSTLRAVPPV